MARTPRQARPDPCSALFFTLRLSGDWGENVTFMMNWRGNAGACFGSAGAQS